MKAPLVLFQHQNLKPGELVCFQNRVKLCTANTPARRLSVTDYTWTTRVFFGNNICVGSYLFSRDTPVAWRGQVITISHNELGKKQFKFHKDYTRRSGGASAPRPNSADDRRNRPRVAGKGNFFWYLRWGREVRASSALE